MHPRHRPSHRDQLLPCPLTHIWVTLRGLSAGHGKRKKCNRVERSAAEIAFQQTSLSLLPEPPVCLSVSVEGKEWEVPRQSSSKDLQTKISWCCEKFSYFHIGLMLSNRNAFTTREEAVPGRGQTAEGRRVGWGGLGYLPGQCELIHGNMG